MIKEEIRNQTVMSNSITKLVKIANGIGRIVNKVEQMKVFILIYMWISDLLFS